MIVRYWVKEPKTGKIAGDLGFKVPREEVAVFVAILLDNGATRIDVSETGKFGRPVATPIGATT